MAASSRLAVEVLQPLYAEEAKQIAAVLVHTDTVQQSLIVMVLQDAVAQVIGEGMVAVLDLELVVGGGQARATVVKL